MLLVVPHLNCNIFCYYCYERRYRQKHKVKMDYDLELILKRMEELKEIYPEMCLHGGEPLMIKKENVRKILLKMKELTGKSAIQTNGSLIDDDFIQIFKECSTHVGLSYDGPGELSKYRFYRLKNVDLDQKIDQMIKEKINLGLIVVVSKSNAETNQLLRKLKDWILKLDKKGISGRLNPCGQAQECELEEKRLIEVYLDLADFCLHHNLKWSPFIDMINGLQGKSRVCSFMGCDFFSTPSAAELLGDGSLTNCMRVNQEYILLRHPLKYETRSEILSQTPQEFGGCQGCQYWKACYGGCPSMAIDNDWRNRTYFCSFNKSLFQFYEKILIYFNISQEACASFNRSIPPEEFREEHGDSIHGDATHGDVPHGDAFQHGDSTRGDAFKHCDEFHGDASHGDAPHGDVSHGDSFHGDIPHGDSTHSDSSA